MFGQDFSLNSAITNLVNGHQTALELSRFRLEDGSDGDNPKRKRKMERGVLSLKNIILSEKKTQKDAVESYLMDEYDSAVSKTIVVKRSKLKIDDRECKVLSFSDITAYKQLRQKEETVKLLKDINETVHHEIMGPIKASVKISKRLMNQNLNTDQ